MKVNVVWDEKMRFEATGPSGHKVVMDAAPKVGGTNSGPRPMEMLLFGAGACTGMDIVSILRRGRQEVTSFEMEIDADRAEEHPKSFTHLRLHYKFHGKDLDRGKVQRAVNLSVEKYCSAINSLQAEVEASFEICD